MKQDIIYMLAANLVLLPGELAVVTYGMIDQGHLTLINFLCWVGACLTVNFILGGCFSAHISEQRELAENKRKRQRRHPKSN